MNKALLRYVLLGAMLFGATAQCAAFGEDVLAASGQYTFFIKPRCGTNATYYQKMVPCVLTEELPTARLITPVYGVPVPDQRKQGIVRTETPVGCAQGSRPCAECFPRETRTTDFVDRQFPVMIPSVMPTWVPDPQIARRPVMLPQWFMVTEEAKAPRK
jgi:hypothetical protein